MDILLHICCGPCLIHPFRILKEKKFKIHGFYYNPNIYPFEEYVKRKEGLESLRGVLDFKVEYPEYEQSDYFQAIVNHESSPERCTICWLLRLKKTAQQAKTLGFKVFSTTLLVSPYQNQELLKQCGYQAARETGVEFYYEDFRVGFKQAQIEAKARGIYRQKYCGCKISMRPQLVERKQV
ncbi:MAG: epoxyqueuosine reductase QueH [Candidatus Omnitrophota bacterium]